MYVCMMYVCMYKHMAGNKRMRITKYQSISSLISVKRFATSANQ